MSLREISENVKLAREYALLGNYSSASVLYQGLLEQINKYVYTVRDGGLQQRWQQVHNNNLGQGRGVLCVSVCFVTWWLLVSAVAGDQRGEPQCPGHHVHPGELPAGRGTHQTQ